MQHTIEKKHYVSKRDERYSTAASIDKAKPYPPPVGAFVFTCSGTVGIVVKRLSPHSFVLQRHHKGRPEDTLLCSDFAVSRVKMPNKSDWYIHHRAGGRVEIHSWQTSYARALFNSVYGDNFCMKYNNQKGDIYEWAQQSRAVGCRQ